MSLVLTAYYLRTQLSVDTNSKVHCHQCWTMYEKTELVAVKVVSIRGARVIEEDPISSITPNQPIEELLTISGATQVNLKNKVFTVFEIVPILHSEDIVIGNLLIGYTLMKFMQKLRWSVWMSLVGV